MGFSDLPKTAGLQSSCFWKFIVPAQSYKTYTLRITRFGCSQPKNNVNFDQYCKVVPHLECFVFFFALIRQYHSSTTILPGCESANGNAFCKTLGTCVCDNGSTNKGPVNRPKLKQKCRAWMYGPDLRPQKSKQITFPPRKNKNWTRN